MCEILGKESRFIDKIKETVYETDLIENLAKKQKIGWASIS